jgi:hypothetical protein
MAAATVISGGRRRMIRKTPLADFFNPINSNPILTTANPK